MEHFDIILIAKRLIVWQESRVEMLSLPTISNYIYTLTENYDASPQYEWAQLWQLGLVTWQIGKGTKNHSHQIPVSH